MRLVVVFAVIAEVQRFWVFADPKPSYKEPPKASETSRLCKPPAEHAWVAEEEKKLQRGFLPSRDCAPKYQPRPSPMPEERYRPQEYHHYQTPHSGSPGFMPQREGIRLTCFQRRPENPCLRCAQLMGQPHESKHVPKDYRPISMSPKSCPPPDTKHHSLPTPHINSEGYQVVNEDPSMHMAVISQPEQYAHPQVITIRDHGQAYTSQYPHHSSQGPTIAYEYPGPNYGMQSSNEGYAPYMPYDHHQHQPEQYQPRHTQHQKSVPYMSPNSERIEVLSNRQILNFVNQ